MKVTITLPDVPKGRPVSVRGLGRFENDVEREVTKEEAELFHRLTGRTVQEAAAVSPTMTVKGASTKVEEGGE